MKQTKTSSILLVIFFTFITTIAQVFMKKGAVSGFFNFYVLLGLILYGFGTIVFIIALKGGELSVLYPIISLGFVWVVISSIIFLNEIITVQKIMGVFLIIIGVAILGLKK